MKYTLTRDDLKTLGNGIRNANSMSLEEHLDAFLADKPTTDWQVIASGEVKNIVYQTGQVIISFNKLPEKLAAGNIICGKDIEIAIRVKE